MIRVKICGITNVDDALFAAESGADAIGLIFSSSPRQVDIQTAQTVVKEIPPFLTSVGVFADEPAEKVMRVLMSCHLDVVQLHGDEQPSYANYFFPIPVVKAFPMKGVQTLQKMKRYETARAFLLDTYHVQKKGGTGKTFNWEWAVKAKSIGKPIILSGGLGPKNIARAVKKVKPYAVDASSGLERKIGRKDKAKVRDFIAIAKETARAILEDEKSIGDVAQR